MLNLILWSERGSPNPGHSLLDFERFRLIRRWNFYFPWTSRWEIIKFSCRRSDDDAKTCCNCPIQFCILSSCVFLFKSCSSFEYSRLLCRSENIPASRQQLLNDANIFALHRLVRLNLIIVTRNKATNFDRQKQRKTTKLFNTNCSMR